MHPRIHHTYPWIRRLPPEEPLEHAAGEVEDDGGAVGADGGGIGAAEAAEQLAGGALRQRAALAHGGAAGGGGEETVAPVGGVGEGFLQEGEDAVAVQAFEAGGSAPHEQGAAAELLEDKAERLQVGGALLQPGCLRRGRTEQ